MKISVLFSSPNNNGNTKILLDSFLQHCSADIELINVYKLRINPCIDCKGCYKTGKCVISDDMEQIYDAIDNSDAVIVASPMYFTTLPGPLKLVIDRYQAYWSRRFILKDKAKGKRKKGVLLMTSGLKGEKEFSHSEAIMKQFFSLINAEFFLSIYAEETDKYPVKSNENIKSSASEKGRELCRAVF